MNRFDNELRTEAHEIHLRAPFALLIALVFLPHESVVPRIKGNPSGFARWANKLRHRSQRADHRGEPEKFEHVFIGLYVKSGEDKGAVRFFDVVNTPPIFGFPESSNLISINDLLTKIENEHEKRNKVKLVF
jgi:hypothetical protein